MAEILDDVRVTLLWHHSGDQLAEALLQAKGGWEVGRQ